MIYWKQHSRDEAIRMKAEATGIAIGEREQAIRIAKSMKEDGIPEDVISKHTGLSLEEIEAL